MRSLIIGGTGSLGKKLINRWKDSKIICVYSRDEAKHWTIRNEIKASNVIFQVGDIRDKDRLVEVIEQFQPHEIIIAAALKQVDTCELSPNEAIKTNLHGTQNVIDAVQKSIHKPQKVLFVSTDKACAPVNVYGMCKSISERLITAQVNDTKTKWLCTRYGNVLESRGSIIPLFRYQAENSDCFTVTDPEMTRFLMTLDESVDLIDRTLSEGKNGETWIPVLRSMIIGDLAKIFSRRYAKPIKVIGTRVGEKKHEDLVNLSESARAYDVTFQGVKNIVIRSSQQHGDNKTPAQYSSDSDVLSMEALEAYLESINIFNVPFSSFVGRSIEEIKK
jgi:UDP-glucose 4-epimerase